MLCKGEVSFPYSVRVRLSTLAAVAAAHSTLIRVAVLPVKLPVHLVAILPIYS